MRIAAGLALAGAAAVGVAQAPAHDAERTLHAGDTELRVSVIGVDDAWGQRICTEITAANVQALMLLARQAGLDTCAQASFIDFHPVLRRHLDLPDDETPFSLWDLRRKLLAVEVSEEDTEAWSWAKTLTEAAPLAQRATKEVAWRSADMGWIESVRFGEVMRKVAGATQDVSEGLSAWQQKRTPDWQGR